MANTDFANPQVPPARAELMTEAMEQIGIHAHRYLQSPAPDTWRDLVSALTRGVGDGEAYELLRAVEMHNRLRGRY